MEIEVPRDRSGSFEPLLIAKGQKRFEGFDEKIIAMYARGMTVREIQGLLLDHYKVEVSADFISTVTDSVFEAVVEWQNRPAWVKTAEVPSRREEGKIDYCMMNDLPALVWAGFGLKPSFHGRHPLTFLARRAACLLAPLTFSGTTRLLGACAAQGKRIRSVQYRRPQSETTSITRIASCTRAIISTRLKPL
jgi:Transposase, Mutator family